MDRLIADLAARQHGVIARRQLLEMGLGRRIAERRLQAGRLHLVHRGVYSVGHSALSREARWMAAVLAAGPGAVASHRCAAAVWMLRVDGRLEVTAPARRRRRGILTHDASLAPDEVTLERGIPVTTPARTLFDLAAVVPRRQLERAVNECEMRRLPDSLSLPALLDRYPSRPGTATIRAILRDGAPLTRSRLEARFLDFVQEAGLPMPETNAWLLVAGQWLEADCLWRDRRVIVELDGRATHDTAAAFERDRARDRMLHARGWRTARVTARQLRGEHEALAYDLRAMLTSAAGTAPSRSTSQSPASS